MNAINEIQDQYALVQEQLKSAAAIVDAVSVLCALERAPEHHDTHPSHNITTGGGKAHGLGVRDDTMPRLLQHAKSLIELANNDADVMCEKAIDGLANVHSLG